MNLRLMLAFGFLSGLPLPLSAFTLQQWFATSGVSRQVVGLTATLGLSYTLKFLWSPLFDRMPPRGLLRFGRRRGWLLLVQMALASACVMLALTDPRRLLWATAAAAACVAFLSASQDVLIDAWRIETFPQQAQATALAAYIYGYRVALLISGAGAIWLSTRAGWHGAILVMAALLASGITVTLLAPEPARVVVSKPIGFAAAATQAFLAPLREFLSRPAAWEILAFVILFRLGHVFADLMAASFYREALGFSSLQVANANFIPMLIGVFAGAAAGAYLVTRLGNTRGLLVAGLAQAASLGLYLLLLAFPGNATALFIKVGGESFASSAADAAFLAYISVLCARAYTATQYALLSSLAAIVFHTLGGASGFVAAGLGWPAFYAATILASLPALVILLDLHRRLGRPVFTSQVLVDNSGHNRPGSQ